MSADQEIEAMSAIARVLDGLDEAAVTRVLRWANDKFNARVSSPQSAVRVSSTSGLSPRDASGESKGADLHELFTITEPKDGPERALVVAYWLQTSQSEDEWAAQSVNSQLTHLGHRVGNITDALNSLKNRSPSLVVQTRKQGSTKQARKLYKLTVAGMRVVEEMLQRGQR